MHTFVSRATVADIRRLKEFLAISAIPFSMRLFLSATPEIATVLIEWYQEPQEEGQSLSQEQSQEQSQSQ